MSTTDPPSSGLELSQSELRSAVSLAAEIYRRDREREFAIAAAEELDTPPEYLARAISIVMQRHAAQEFARRARFASLHNIVVGVLIVSAIVAIVWPLYMWRQYSAPAPAVSTPSPMWPTPPAAATRANPPVTIGTLAVSPRILARLRSVSSRISGDTSDTSITFRNTLPQPVRLRCTDAFAHAQDVAVVRPGDSFASPAKFGDPWLAYDDSRLIGLFFPMSGPTTAMITAKAEAPAAGRNAGYLRPTSIGGYAPLPAAIDYEWLIAMMEFVNLSGRPVNLYVRGNSGNANWITRIGDGESYYTARASIKSQWIVADEHGRARETFTTPDHGGVALITPDVLRQD